MLRSNGFFGHRAIRIGEANALFPRMRLDEVLGSRLFSDQLVIRELREVGVRQGVAADFVSFGRGAFYRCPLGRREAANNAKKRRGETFCIEHGLRHRKLLRRVVVECVGNGARPKPAPSRKLIWRRDRGRKRGAGYARYAQDKDCRGRAQRAIQATFSPTFFKFERIHGFNDQGSGLRQ